MAKRLEMDEVCELSSQLVEYIVKHHTNYKMSELSEIQDNSDEMYSDRVQDIFNDVSDLIDNYFNPER